MSHCVSCGEPVPEGRQVCSACEKKSIDTQPCRGCADRCVNCHSACHKYKAYQEWHRQVTAKEKFISKYF